MSWTSIYNEDYKDRYLQLGQTPLGKAIHTGRWALVTKYVKGGTLLDYGCGPGTFNAFGPSTFNRLNYDINPACGFTSKPWEEKVIQGAVAPRHIIDVLTMWDSIEHDPEFFNNISAINPEWIFISTPNLESLLARPIIGWPHYRPGEHIFYFDRHSLKVVLEALGYEIVEINFDDGRLRRPEHPDWIITVVARRVQK